MDLSSYIQTPPSPSLSQTVKVQGNDISHKLQISRVGKSDEGLYECRVTNANYGELLEYKAQAYLKVNATAHPRRPPPKKTSPLHLTADKKPRKPSGASGGQDGMSSDQRLGATSSSHTASSKTVKHSTGSGETHTPTPCHAGFLGWVLWDGNLTLRPQGLQSEYEV